MAEGAIAKPRRILLATDLTARCDRALDRAVRLSRDMDAELVAAHVADPADSPQFYLDRPLRSWRRIPDPAERMRWRLRRDLADAASSDAHGLDIRAVVEEGDAAEKLIEIARRESCGLIVAGSARADSVGRTLFGSTVNRVLRGVSVPILVVRDRPVRPYRDIVIAADFSDASIEALRTVPVLFPDSRLTLFHAYDIPFAGFVADRDWESELRLVEAEVTAKFLADERIDPALKACVEVVIEHGTPETLLSDFVEERAADLTVIGSHGRGAIYDAVIGSTAKRLVETLEGDLLIVRHPGARR